MDYQRRFGGISRLYGAEGLERLAAADVCVVGVGGVGSWAAEALARSGIGAITLIDMDHVAESNINRQLPALDATLGQAKVQALRERIAQINPGCRVRSVEDFVSVDNVAVLVGEQHDWVIDCIDSFRVKAALIAFCRRRRQRVITVGGAGGQRDPARVRVCDLRRTEQDPLLARTRRLLRQDHGFPTNPRRRFNVPSVWSDEPQAAPSPDCETPTQGSLNCAGYGAVMTVTASFGLVAAGYVINALAADRKTRRTSGDTED